MNKSISFALTALFTACTSSPAPQMSMEEGTLGDLGQHIDRFLAAEPAMAVLIVELPGSQDDFIQFTASEEEVELDHPLITPRQRDREWKMRMVLEEVGCEPRIITGSDGSRFLDCTLPRSRGHVLEASEAVLTEVFNVEEGSQLVFTSSGGLPNGP